MPKTNKLGKDVRERKGWGKQKNFDMMALTMTRLVRFDQIWELRKIGCSYDWRWRA